MYISERLGSKKNEHCSGHRLMVAWQIFPTVKFYFSILKDTQFLFRINRSLQQVGMPENGTLHHYIVVATSGKSVKLFVLKKSFTRASFDKDLYEEP